MEGLIHGGTYFRNFTVFYCNDEITLVTRRIDPDSQTIVISDDFVREKNQNKLVDYFMQGRNKNCSGFFLS